MTDLEKLIEHRDYLLMLADEVEKNFIKEGRLEKACAIKAYALQICCLNNQFAASEIPMEVFIDDTVLTLADMKDFLCRCLDRKRLN